MWTERECVGDKREAREERRETEMQTRDKRERRGERESARARERESEREREREMVEPPSEPVYPELQRQSVSSSLPVCESVFAGQLEQASDPWLGL